MQSLVLLGKIYFASFTQIILPNPHTNNHLGYPEYLPLEYNTTIDISPYKIFQNRSGKAGSDHEPNICIVPKEGPFKEIRCNKHNQNLIINGKQDYLIVIGPQIEDCFSATNFQNIYEHVLSTYRNDPQRNNVTGLGMGGKSDTSWTGNSINSLNVISRLGIIFGPTDRETANLMGS